jgi:Tfp pilus assembly protein PilF
MGGRQSEALKKAISLDSTLARAHNQLGLLCLHVGQQTEAETELKAAITVDPGYAEAQNNLGVLYGQQRKNKQAEELFRQATENNPQYTQAFINLGLILAGESRFPARSNRYGTPSRSAPTTPRRLLCLRRYSCGRSGVKRESLTSSKSSSWIPSLPARI